MHKVSELSRHQRKPDPDVVREICRGEDVLPEQTAYVGDSMARDILMARMAGVFAIWAKYGASHQRAYYQDLVRVTHWTAEDIARETEASERARGVTPDYVLESGFDEILKVLLPSDRPFPDSSERGC